MILIGIDIGLTGALGMLGHDAEFLQLADMPTMGRQGNGAYVKNQVSPAALAELLRAWTEAHSRNEVHILIETPIAFPAQHVATTAAAFLTAGLVEGVVAARQYAHTLVHPKEWKKAFYLSDDKEQSRAKAIRMWPDAAAQLARKKDHNRAEALLIARYGWDRLS